LFSANVVEFKEPGVSVVKLSCGGNDLFGEANGGEELVGEGGVDTIKALTPIV
jgi:hypothetical protein